MPDYKLFSMRLSRENWIFLKKHIIDQETSMAEIINELVDDYRKKIQKKDKKELTGNDDVI